MQPTNSTFLKFGQIRAELRSEYIERDEQIDGALISLLSRQHVLLLGQPGTAKSELISKLCSRIDGAQYFTWLLTKFSTPEELFGPVSLKALEQDEYKRITAHKLPEAHIGFLDEIFKANSAILNSLLTLINERKFHNNGSPASVPLLSLFGASNELPESEELNALFDRFLLRYVVGYISEDGGFRTMLKGAGPAATTTITLAELAAAQKEVEAVQCNDEVIDTITKLRSELKKEGIVPSDRRFKLSLNLLRAHAWLNGRQIVTEDDIPLLQHVFWQAPTDIKTVQRVVLAVSNPILSKITEFVDQATEIYKNTLDAVKADSKQGSGQGIEANTKLKKISEELQKLQQQLQSRNRETRQVAEAVTKITGMNKAILKECLGLEL